MDRLILLLLCCGLFLLAFMLLLSLKDEDDLLALDPALASLEVLDEETTKDTTPYYTSIYSKEVMDMFRTKVGDEGRHHGCAKKKKMGNPPLLSSMTLRSFSTYLFEDKLNCAAWQPEDVEYGDIIFLESKEELIRDFFETYHPKVRHPYILIAHDGHDWIPPQYYRYLDDRKTLAWFITNPIGIKHSKVNLIPKGVSDEAGSLVWFRELQELKKRRNQPEKRRYKLYVNVPLKENAPERITLATKFEWERYALVRRTDVSAEQYRKDLASSMFALCPRGEGLDTHCTWEALMVGTVPIVKSSLLDVLYTDLPVVIVNSWHEKIDEKWLMDKYAALKTMQFNMQRVYFPYWADVILVERGRFLNSGQDDRL